MSRKDAEKFVRTLMEDESMLNELKNRLDVSSFEDVNEETLREDLADVAPDFAAEHGYEFTVEEGFSVLDDLQGNNESDALSDVELEKVAGGKSGSVSFTGPCGPNN